MRILVDGYNLLFMEEWALHLSGLRFEEKREKLLTLLALYQKRRHHSLFIIFDAKHTAYPYAHRDKRGELDILYTETGISADEVILKHAKKSDIVVTSDNALAKKIREKGASVISCKEFVSRLKEADSSKREFKEEEEEERPRKSKKGPARKLPKEKRKHQRLLKKV